MHTPIPAPLPADLNALQGHAALAHCSVICASGADAARFLHGQLSCDVLSLDLNTVRLAGFCSAKGRLQASFWIWRVADDDILLLCSASVADSICKRLQMFVLRAKCQISRLADLAMTGFWGAFAATYLDDIAQLHHAAQEQGAQLIRLPDVHGVPRAVWVGASSATGLFDALKIPPEIVHSPIDTWRWLDVQSGIPMIEAATADQFVPQMINFELLGGVNFQKGCYPGQEVVARSQYRGVIKRRLFLFHSAQAMQAGQAVFHSDDPEQPAGMVVNAAPWPAQVIAAAAGNAAAAALPLTHSALIEIKLAALSSGHIHLNDVNGPVVQQGTLPYAVSVTSDTESSAPKAV
jgi:tRNA-modifying protein YgfZ